MPPIMRPDGARSDARRSRAAAPDQVQSRWTRQGPPPRGTEGDAHVVQQLGRTRIRRRYPPITRREPPPNPAANGQAERLRPTGRPVTEWRLPFTPRKGERTTFVAAPPGTGWRSRQRHSPTRRDSASRARAWQTLTKAKGQSAYPDA